MDEVVIRPPVDKELAIIQGIEVAAGQLFADSGMALVAEHDPFTIDELQGFVDRRMAWVAAPPVGSPVAYLVAEVIDGAGHVEQLTVHPDHGGRRLGVRLMDHFVGWCVGGGLPAVTLTTFAEVPWNRPYYGRLGFRVLGDDEITPGLAAIRTYEAAIGLDAWPRVCMRRDLR